MDLIRADVPFDCQSPFENYEDRNLYFDTKSTSTLAVALEAQGNIEENDDDFVITELVSNSGVVNTGGLQSESGYDVEPFYYYHKIEVGGANSRRNSSFLLLSNLSQILKISFYLCVLLQII